MAKRAPMMKNAPNVEVQIPATRNHSTSPSAPSIGALQQRVQSMTGDSVTLHINNRDIVFNLKVIAAEAVERATSVYNGNERDQELLTEDSLADILPTFRDAGQQFPAIGRNICGITEVADGSRRRAAAILSGRSYRVLIGDLTEEDMQWLTKLGNDYTPPSAYERGKRYARLLKNNFDGNLTALAESEGISRRVLSRYVKTATLPIEVIKAFAVPNDLSMKSGEVLAGLLPDWREEMIAAAVDIADRRKGGEVIEGDDVFSELRAVAERKARKEPTTREFGKGIKAVYKGSKVTVQLQDAPDHLLKEIERLLEKHQRHQSASSVDLSLDELDKVVKLIKAGAKMAERELTKNQQTSLIVGARGIMAKTSDSDERILEMSELITTTFL